MNTTDNLFKKQVFKNLHSDGINSIEVLDNISLFTCDDNSINLYNTETNTKQNLYTTPKNKLQDELSCLKCFSLSSCENKYLFASNNEFLQLFDINTFKQINKYKFSKETINCIELNQAKNIIGCCDDSGIIFKCKFQNIN